MTDLLAVFQWVSVLRSLLTDPFGNDFHRALASTAVLAYVLGLRHALDADHISVRSSNVQHTRSDAIIGYRPHDKTISSKRSKACHNRHLLLTGTFDVSVTMHIVLQCPTNSVT